MHQAYEDLESARTFLDPARRCKANLNRELNPPAVLCLPPGGLEAIRTIERGLEGKELSELERQKQPKKRAQPRLALSGTLVIH